MAIKTDVRSETSEKYITAEFIHKLSKKRTFSVWPDSSKQQQQKSYASKSVRVLISKLSRNKQYLT